MIAKIFASGILLLDIGLIALLSALLVKKFTGHQGVRRYVDEAFEFLTQYYREAAFVLGTTSTLGSLYMSKILEIPACEFCWYQRILIFLMPVILGVSIFMDKDDVADYILSLAMLGVPISLYHYIVQMTRISTSSCSTAVSCNSVQVHEFGFVTMPWMSLTFFCSTVVLMLLSYRRP